MSLDPDRNVMMPHGAEVDVMEPEIRYLGDVQKLDLGPDDIIVVSVDQYLSCEIAERIKSAIAKAVGSRPVLVLGKGMTIGALSPKEAV